jgi:hypothetical protein
VNATFLTDDATPTAEPDRDVPATTPTPTPTSAPTGVEPAGEAGARAGAEPDDRPGVNAPASAGEEPAADRTRAGLTVTPPPWLDRALEVAIIAAKGATIACAIDGFVNADTPRLRGKGIRARAFGYTGALFLVPAIWRMLPNRGRYPRGLDLAVTLPLLVDAAGNSLGLYDEAHLDDVVHFLNAGIASGVAGSLFATRTDDPWEAAVAGASASIAAEAIWEVGEYVAMKAGANGMNLSYGDTIGDIADTIAGAIIGGVVTWLRMPRAKTERRRGWRHAVSGFRDAGEPISIIGGHGTVAERALHPAR